MKCSSIEKQIYLYPELNDREREETDRHVAACASCRKLFERVNDERDVLQKALRIDPVVPDQAALTSRVMSAIHAGNQSNRSILRNLWRDIRQSPLRYAMMALSLILIVTFISEATIPSDRPFTTRIVKNVDHAVTLNSASLYQASEAAAGKETRSTFWSVYECIVKCPDPALAYCSDCFSKYTYFKQHYEKH